MLKRITIFLLISAFAAIGYAQTGTFTGTVTDDGGLPMEGASVSLSTWGGWWGGNYYCTETLEDGSFLIEDVEVGEYTASAFAWGYGMESEAVEIIEGETTTVNFVLEEFGWGGGGGGPYGSCSGTVVDDTGLPIEGVSVSLHSDSGWGWGWGWGNNYSTTTLEDGTFNFAEVQVGDYSASAFAWGYMMASEDIEIIEDENTVVNFTLEEFGGGGGGPYGTCSGTVVDEASLPLEGVSVSLHSNSGWGWGNNYSTTTLEDGTFSFDEVQVGEYSASAFAWGYMMAYENIEIVENENTVVDFTLEEFGWGGGGGPTGIFSGTVVDTAGNPLEGVAITALNWGWGNWGWYSTETGEDGSFTIDDIEVGEYTATAFLWEYGLESEQIEIIEGETTTIDFVLEGWGGGWGWGGGGWTVTTVELSGIAMVEENGWWTSYSLDVDGDEVADYSLNFGAPDYDPGSGATRPEDGDAIDIVGGQMECGWIPTVIVYEINGLWWRDPIGTDRGDLRRLKERMRNHSGDQLVSVRNHPNPFNPETTISYELNDASNVTIEIFNSLGQKVVSLFDGEQESGAYDYSWNAGNYSSGFYFVKFNVNGYVSTHRILLTK